MNVLLDTCGIIWAVSEPNTLTPKVRHLLQSPETRVFVSPISAAEVACAVERGRIELDRHWRLWFRHYIDMNEWSLIDIGLDVTEEAYSLPGAFHADPADRILVATARLYKLTLVTADSNILNYPHVKTVW